MLIAALVMVLFANHMDERLIQGKRVIQCGGHREAGMNIQTSKSNKDREPLVVNATKEAEDDSSDNVSV